jgi:hypothetical protein
MLLVLSKEMIIDKAFRPQHLPQFHFLRFCKVDTILIALLNPYRFSHNESITSFWQTCQALPSSSGTKALHAESYRLKAGLLDPVYRQ